MTKRDAAVEIILDLYGDGVRAAQAFYLAGAAAGISERRMRAARGDVGLVAERTPASGYVWKLPVRDIVPPRTCICSRPNAISYVPWENGEALACAKCDRPVTPIRMLLSGRDAHKGAKVSAFIDSLMRANGTSTSAGVDTATVMTSTAPAAIRAAGWDLLARDVEGME